MMARLLIVPTFLFLVVLVGGCGSENQAIFGPDDATILLAKDKGCPGSGHPSCKPDEPTPPSGADELTLTGNFAADAWVASVDSDNKKWLKISSAGQDVAIDFSNTVLDTCSGNVAELFGALSAPAQPADVKIQIPKASVGTTDPAHWITVQRDVNNTAIPLVLLNHSTGDYPDALVELIEGDLDDASQPRSFRFSNGAVRVVQHVDPHTPSLQMICEQAAGDEVVVTIAPATP